MTVGECFERGRVPPSGRLIHRAVRAGRTEAPQVQSFYLEGQHNVLWLQEARADQIRWGVHAEDKDMGKENKQKEEATQRQRTSHKTQTHKVEWMKRNGRMRPGKGDASRQRKRLQLSKPRLHSENKTVGSQVAKQ